MIRILLHLSAFLSAFTLLGAERPLPSELLARLSDELRVSAIETQLFGDEQIEAFRKGNDEFLRYSVLRRASSQPETMDLVLKVLPGEPTVTKRALLVDIGNMSHWVDNTSVQTSLRAYILHERDAALIAQALNSLRVIEMKRIRGLLKLRMDQARESGDSALRLALANEDGRWVALQRATMLPGFLANPVPPFSVNVAGERVRVVGMGDFGRGSEAQRQVAAGMARRHAEQRFDFGITFGDNFYSSGMYSPSDSRWGPWWEALYSPLGIPFYASLGNHDWIHPDSPAAEILYGEKSRSWRLPSPYYTYTAGPVQFFVVNTEDLAEGQALWLDQAIRESRATWKVVYGHHPIHVASTFGEGYTAAMREKLWPHIRGRVDAYFCGHHHSMGEMAPVEGVRFFISGGGGTNIYQVNANHPDALFAETMYGFNIIEADARQMVVLICDAEGKERHRAQWTK